MSLSLPRRVLRLQYSIARLPLQALEATVISRLDAEGPIRATYQQIMGGVDGTVGALLGDEELAQRGQKMRSAAADLEKAARLEAQAREKRAEATRESQRKVDEASARAKKARSTAEEKIDDAAETEIDAKVQAGKQATARLEDRKSRADDIADKRISAAEAERQAKLSEVERREEEAKAPRTDEIEDATEKLESADEARDDAERLADVVEASKDT
ncbi:hypothetical protein ASG56_06830 [Rhodococcus sp. Leaf7]|uniref:hypothetical protein n=1 Tax=unclassified Rhodococcus (in: high G+C Gram-positive bacteria) TaxID=192944 RepID=UPI0006FAA7E9|nr:MULTISPECIES: hypothetical protein [unclassified Rhodococcus (in: high G+C Gram-positive bacteria)]KQU07242.1 hypothetical protein ASG56_06830 [Rhodococcus sp. Leaf7]KQU42760.1 hypothetical protein ASG64_06830 [Rhodococcus sp. Leaf247]